MTQRNGLHNIKRLIGIFFVFGAMILAGCGSMRTYSGKDFDSKGLPNQKYLVGGGLQIEWVAPQKGTAYLVEETTGKIVMTKSLQPGDTFEFSPGQADPKEAKEVFGVDMSELKFFLFFVPANKVETE
jgi:hypothetical protein